MPRSVTWTERGVRWIGREDRRERGWRGRKDREGEGVEREGRWRGREGGEELKDDSLHSQNQRVLLLH